MLTAGILDFMLLGEAEEGFSAGPPIQRWANQQALRQPLMRKARAAPVNWLEAALASSS